jgi:uncharacterized membrane protein
MSKRFSLDSSLIIRSTKKSLLLSPKCSAVSTFQLFPQMLKMVLGVYDILMGKKYEEN